MNDKKSGVAGADVPIVELRPIRERKAPAKDFEQLKANIESIGLIEPLCVCDDDGQYCIVDGYLRYKVLLELGVEMVPCLVIPRRDIYTFNRQVNNLSPRERIKMLRKAMKTIDEKTIAKAFNLHDIREQVNANLFRRLHKKVVAAIENEKLPQNAAKEMRHVTTNRQLEILKLLQQSGDWSIAFVKTQVLNTKKSDRTKECKNSPWNKSTKQKRDLMKKLAEVEKHYDFYNMLYRDYVSDLLKLTIYARQIINRPTLREYLQDNFPEDLELLQDVIDSHGQKQVG